MDKKPLIKSREFTNKHLEEYVDAMVYIVPTPSQQFNDEDLIGNSGSNVFALNHLLKVGWRIEDKIQNHNGIMFILIRTAFKYVEKK